MCGEVRSTKYYDNSKTRISPFYKNTDKLRDYIYNNIRWDSLPNIQNEVKVFSLLNSNEAGKIDSVSIIRGDYPIFNNEAIRILKSIPEWNVLYRHGKLIQCPIAIPIIFNNDMRQKYKR